MKSLVYSTACIETLYGILKIITNSNRKVIYMNEWFAKS